jgi:hypothetical protein
MEHPYILPFITQRMKEMGFEKFHFETIRVKNLPLGPYALDLFSNDIISNNRYSNRVAEIDASNQFLFLVEKTVNTDLKITSDTGYLLPSEGVDYSNYTFHNFKEFTGQVFISSFSSFDLEFIKVNPYD